MWDRACAAVGSALAQPEVVAALMPAVLGKWESLRDDERALIPCTECLSALVGALGPQFLPFVEPLYGRIMRLVHARTAALATPELEEPDFDWPCVSLDLLSAMLESFGPQMAPLLESSGGVALIVQAAGIDPETEMKRVLFACLGDLAKNCWELLAPHAQALLPMLLHHFNPFCEPPRLHSFYRPTLSVCSRRHRGVQQRDLGGRRDRDSARGGGCGHGLPGQRGGEDRVVAQGAEALPQDHLGFVLRCARTVRRASRQHTAMLTCHRRAVAAMCPDLTMPVRVCA